MIRQARDVDIPALVDLGEKLFDQTAPSLVAQFDAASFRGTLEILLAAQGLLVAEHNGNAVGMIGFLVFPLYTNHAKSVAQEMFVIADHPGAGVSLMREFEREAKARGAVMVTSAAQVGMRDAALSRVYRKLGFVEYERSFLKVL